MITIHESIEVVTKQVMREPQVYITGDSTLGTRMMTVQVLIADETGREIGSIVRQYTGKDYNTVYALYNSDKALLDYVLADTEYADTELPIPDNLENPALKLGS